jgi:predicted dehydrogenase
MRRQGSVGFGIVGCGNIGRVHAETIERIPDARLVAVCSRSLESAKRLGEKYGIPFYTDYKELLRQPGLDVVNLCTPSGARAEIAVAAAQAGKHLVSEKPLEVTLQRIDTMIRACEENNVKLAAVFNVRFYKATKLARQAVQAGRLGQPILGDVRVKWYRSQEYYDQGSWRGTWEFDGGGALMNQSIHYIDLLQWMFGPVKTVYAHTATLSHERIEVEDTAVATLVFENEALGVIEGATSVWPGFPARVELHGTRGTIALQEQHIVTWKLADASSEEEERMLRVGTEDESTGRQDPRAFHREGHLIQLRDMVEAVLEDRPPLIDGREGRKAVELILAIYRSAQMGQAVHLPLDL